MRHPIVVITALLWIVITPAALAAPWQWQSTNLQLLRGHGYQTADEQRSIATLEHAHGWAYGDNYAFVDVFHSDGGEDSYYGELAPRLSLGKLSGRGPGQGLLRDLLLAVNIEKPKHQHHRRLWGLGSNLNLPGMQLFAVNLYVRDDPQLSGRTWQLTTVWRHQSPLWGSTLLLEGFADFAGAENASRQPNQLIVPRVLLDMAPWLHSKPGQLWLGMEYSYWHNKFGLDGVTESVPQLQLKWVL